MAEVITAVNRHTGEIVELEADSFEQVVEAWRIAKEYEKVSEALKKQLKELVPNYINDKGVSEEYKGHMFRVSNIQRKTFDKAVMREVLDEDTYDQFLKPDTTNLKKYIKDNLERLGDVSTRLTKSMVPDGNPYQVIKLEKLVRDDN